MSNRVEVNTVQVTIVFSLDLASLSPSAAIAALIARGPVALGVKSLKSSLALSRPLAGKTRYPAVAVQYSPHVVAARGMCWRTHSLLSSDLLTSDHATVCGNGRCEFGESAASCSADCPVGIQSCPFATTGHGTCMPSSGTCSCFHGYIGSACDRCDSGYTSSLSDGTCTFLPGALSSCSDGVQNGNEAGIDCGGRCPSCTTSKSATVHALTSVPVVVGGGIAVLVASVLVALLVRRQLSLRRRAKAGRRRASTTTSLPLEHKLSLVAGSSRRQKSTDHGHGGRRGSAVSVAASPASSRQVPAATPSRSDGFKFAGTLRALFGKMASGNTLSAAGDAPSQQRGGRGRVKPSYPGDAAEPGGGRQKPHRGSVVVVPSVVRNVSVVPCGRDDDADQAVLSPMSTRHQRVEAITRVQHSSVGSDTGVPSTNNRSKGTIGPAARSQASVAVAAPGSAATTSPVVRGNDLDGEPDVGSILAPAPQLRLRDTRSWIRQPGVAPSRDGAGNSAPSPRSSLVSMVTSSPRAQKARAVGAASAPRPTSALSGGKGGGGGGAASSTTASRSPQVASRGLALGLLGLTDGGSPVSAPTTPVQRGFAAVAAAVTPTGVSPSIRLPSSRMSVNLKDDGGDVALRAPVATGTSRGASSRSTTTGSTSTPPGTRANGRPTRMSVTARQWDANVTGAAS